MEKNEVFFLQNRYSHILREFCEEIIEHYET